jgi:hypothetical protein
MQSTPNIPTIAVDEHAVAAALSVSVWWVRKDRIKARLIPFYRIGGHIRYDIARVHEALAAMQEGGQGGKPPRKR